MITPCARALAYVAGLAAFLPATSHAEPVITEFVAATTDLGFTDEDGEPSDWIEIHNPTASTISTAGYSLTDDPQNLDQWGIPPIEIPPGGYLVVFASDKNRTDPGSELHTNFRLSNDGEYLALVAPNGAPVSEFSPAFPEQFNNISYGIGQAGPIGQETFLDIPGAVTYLVPDPPPAGGDWRLPAYDDSSWSAAQTGLGFGAGYEEFIGSGGDLFGEMFFAHPNVLIRAPFQVDDPQAVVSLVLEMFYDDGFVAYLNGHRVASTNAPDPVDFNSAAPLQTEEDGTPDFFSLDFAGHLVAGTNILAIHGLNSGESSSDFLISPRLVGEVQDLSQGEITGYFKTPTPGAPNGNALTHPPGAITFSSPTRTFTSPFQLALSTPTPGATIRYTLDGTLPTDSLTNPSPAYSSPIPISSSTLVRARAFLPGALEGPGRSEGYFKLHQAHVGFTSDLPVVMLSTFGGPGPPESGSTIRNNVFMAVFEPDPDTGRTTLTSTPTVATRAGFRKRGSSSSGWPKYGMSLESWDEFGLDRDVAPAGMSPEADWILNARYQFDLSLMRNPFLYALSNQIGRWAVDTRFVELFNDVTGGDVVQTDYFGVYEMMEKIEPDGDRLDIEKLRPWENSEPEISGGYVFKNDRADPGEPTLPINGFPRPLVLSDPDGDMLTPQQRTWLTGHLNAIDAALDRADGTNPSTGLHFTDYLDVGSFIDNFWLNILSMNPDWGRLSQFFYKDRGGLVHAGPAWDYDRTMGSRDGRDDNPLRWEANTDDTSFTWYDDEYQWFGHLFGFTTNQRFNPTPPQLVTTRPDVFQQVIDRWYALRETDFSKTNLEAIVDSMAAELAEAQARNFARWTQHTPGAVSGTDYSAPGTAGWQKEVSHLKGWLEARTEWIDDQFYQPPVFNVEGGVVEEGFEVVITPHPDDGQADVIYTLDGTDPRAQGGGLSASAAQFGSERIVHPAITPTSSASYFVPQDASIHTVWHGRTFDDSAWLSGTNGFGFESTPGAGLDPEVATNIREDMHPPEGTWRPGCYFRYHFTFDPGVAVEKITLGVKSDDGFVAFLNGTEVASIRVPNPVLFDSTATGSIADSTTAANYQPFDLTAFESALVDGDNVLAIQGLNSSALGSDFLIKAVLDIEHTVSIEPLVLDGSATVIARSYDGEQWGAPKTVRFIVGADPASADNLVVSQIMYHPAAPTAAEQAAGFTDQDDFEYIELTNISDLPVDLGDVTFTAGLGFTFASAPVTTLPPGGRVLVVQNLGAFQARYGTTLDPLIAGSLDGGSRLSNSGERLALAGLLGTIKDFAFDDGAPWPTSPDGSGPALVLIKPGSNPNHSDPTNWRASTSPLGTPGASDAIPFTGNPDADTDADKLSAFVEYALGTSDLQPDTLDDILTAGLVEEGGSRYFTFAFQIQPAADDARVTPEVSQHLATWSPATTSFAKAGEFPNPDGTLTVVYQSLLSASQAPTFYVRLKVTAR